MKLVDQAVRRIDAWQQGNARVAFLVGVVRKFGDDSGATLAALIAYYGFLSLFPLLLVLITVLGLFFAHDASLQHRILDSAFGQFPIVGRQLATSGLRSLRAGSAVGFVVGMLGLVWGSLRVSQAAQRAMADVWNVPRVNRPRFLPKLGRGIGFLALLGVDVGLTTFLAGLVTIGHGALWFQVLAGIVGLAVNVALYLAGFRILTPRSVTTDLLIPGAVVAGIGWTILQYAGTVLVGHTLRHANQIYGYFGSVLGLISFLYLAAQLTVYAAEVNVVRARHMYPRSIVTAPTVRADDAVVSAVAREGGTRPEPRLHADVSDAADRD